MLNAMHHYDKFNNRVRLVFGIFNTINKRLKAMLALN